MRAHPLYWRADSLAGYIAHDGEIDPAGLLRSAMREGRHVCLPRLHPLAPGRLDFATFCEHSRLLPNRYGIPEPWQAATRPAWVLDMILMPLVGFDRNGGRLGMGGGYYDRSLASLQTCARMRRPVLVGLAHACQEVDSLASASWDVALDWVVTVDGWIRANREP